MRDEQEDKQTRSLLLPLGDYGHLWGSPVQSARAPLAEATGEGVRMEGAWELTRWLSGYEQRLSL